MLLPWLCGACAVDGLGTTAALSTLADGAVVIDVYAVGAHVRTRSDDLGFGLGVGRRTYIFAASKAEELKPGWSFFWAPLPRREAVALYRSQLGLDIYREADRVGLTLGLRSGAAIAWVPSGQTAIIELDYEPAAPTQTRLRTCWGESECGEYFWRQ